MSRIVVLGAGVSGLTTAFCLYEEFREKIKDLTIVASEFVGDYHAHDFASPWAGANWASFAKIDEIDQIERDKAAYLKFSELSTTDPASGVKSYMLKSCFLKEKGLPWYIQQKFVKNITMLSAEELRFRNLDPELYYGVQFQSFTVTPTIYCAYMLNKLRKLGATIKRVARLDLITDVVPLVGYVPDLVVNATGINAAKLLRLEEPDELKKALPVKGQILQIYEDLPFQVMIEGLPKELGVKTSQFLNIFPRAEGGCVVGGIMAKGDWSKTVDKDLSESILKVCKNHVPELKATTVYNSYVALRPGREGGVRIELSEYKLEGQNRSLKVVHNYGIGAAGYQSSYGSARQVCELASKVLGSRKKSSKL
ncbi:LAFA_0G15126g1_1 [Lachancea sp. 'fantastica']|nr:LAFA_0G15126g1_1 [Lachancea sp. 'fantastica']